MTITVLKIHNLNEDGSISYWISGDFPAIVMFVFGGYSKCLDQYPTSLDLCFCKMICQLTFKPSRWVNYKSPVSCGVGNPVQNCCFNTTAPVKRKTTKCCSPSKMICISWERLQVDVSHVGWWSEYPRPRQKLHQDGFSNFKWKTFCVFLVNKAPLLTASSINVINPFHIRCLLLLQVHTNACHMPSRRLHLKSHAGNSAYPGRFATNFFPPKHKTQ